MQRGGLSRPGLRVLYSHPACALASFRRFNKLVVRTAIAMLLVVTGASAQKPVGNRPSPSALQPVQLGDASGECKACHPRQYFEMKQAVHFGYRNISPMFNGLEVAGNFL